VVRGVVAGSLLVSQNGARMTVRETVGMVTRDRELTAVCDTSTGIQFRRFKGTPKIGSIYKTHPIADGTKGATFAHSRVVAVADRAELNRIANSIVERAAANGRVVRCPRSGWYQVQED
jgi:hypothetical protein